MKPHGKQPPSEPAADTVPLKGRGASWNPQNRFETLAYVRDDEAGVDDDAPAPRTVYLRDPSRSIIAHNDSPDLGFDSSVNPYRGCEHGCIYCFARPTHEFLGFSAGLDFETKIVVKEDAPELLREELNRKSWVPRTIVMSGVTDPYQPIERKLEITRGCLAVLAEFRNPVALITKNHLVTRDVDHLGELAQFGASTVAISLTTLDPALARIMEPRTSMPEKRLEAIETLSRAGVPVAVMTAPMIPAINDHELPALLKAARDAGATSAGFVVLRLPWAVAPLFEQWLDEHFPDRKEKVLGRIRQLRDGKLYDSAWGQRGRGTGPYAEQIKTLFEVTARKLGLNEHARELSTMRELSTAHFRRRTAQGSLF
jgi:DNA repair photolyase